MKRKLNVAFTVALIASMLFTSVGLADVLHGDDLNTGGNTTKTPGQTGTAAFYLTANAECNASPTSPTRVAVSSNQSWVTIAAPGYFDLVGCDKSITGAFAGSIGYSVSSLAPVGGVATISGSASGGIVGNDGYNTTPGKFTVTVTAPTKVDATCTISGYTGAYDGLAHGASGTCTDAGGLPVGTLDFGATFTNVPGGTAHWTFTGGANYTDQSGDAAIVISPAPVTATAGSGSGPYDGLTHAPSACAVTGNYIGDLSCINNPVSVGPAAGTSVIMPVVSGTALGNFNILPVNGSYTINKAEAACTIDGYSGVYDAAFHGATGSCSGVNGESAGTLDLGPSFKDVPGGTAHWVFTGNANYENRSGDAAIVISKADAACLIDGYSGVYDTFFHGATGSCLGIGGEYAGNLDLGAQFKDVPGGEAQWAFTGNGNYSDQSGIAPILISKADATCSVAGYSGVYDTFFHGATGSCFGIGGENAGTLALGATYRDVPGGTATWAFTGNGNYNDQGGEVAIVIEKAEATCSVSGYSGVYDAEFHGATGSCAGIGGEPAGTLDLGATYKNVPGGTAHWAFTGNINYKDQAGEVDIVISKANATCDVSGYSGVYDTALHGATGSCSGIDGEEAGTLALGATYKNVPGGTAHWVFTGNGNYYDQSGDVAIEIAKADATCTISGWTGTLDGLPHGASGSCSGIGGENAGTLDLGASFTSVPGGTAHWVFTGNGNYKDQSGDVIIDINYAPAGTMCMGAPGHAILQPINADNTSVFKQKSTVPAKFRVCDANGVPIGTPGVVTSFRLIQTSYGTVVADVDEAVVSTTPDTAFRWSASDQQWIYNINTKNLAAGKTYVYLITLNDGSTIQFQFGLK